MSDPFAPVEIDPHDRPLLEKIGRLRVLAWSTVMPDAAARSGGCWLDEFELVARHWCIFHDGEPVAAARLSVHDRIEDVPEACIYVGLGIELPPPITSLNRLVTHPDYRGRGFSGRLDTVRAAELTGCAVCSVSRTVNYDRRVRQLRDLSFEPVGGLAVIPCGAPDAGKPTQPMVRRPRSVP